jgi:hypothetical protein
MVMVSPTLPPEEIYEMFISVETPVANNPLEATAKDLQLGTIQITPAQGVPALALALRTPARCWVN